MPGCLRWSWVSVILEAAGRGSGQGRKEQEWDTAGGIGLQQSWSLVFSGASVFIPDRKLNATGFSSGAEKHSYCLSLLIWQSTYAAQLQEWKKLLLKRKETPRMWNRHLEHAYFRSGYGFNTVQRLYYPFMIFMVRTRITSQSQMMNLYTSLSWQDSRKRYPCLSSEVSLVFLIPHGGPGRMLTRCLNTRSITLSTEKNHVI